MIRTGLLLAILASTSALDILKDPHYYINLVNSANTSWTAGHNFPLSTSYDYIVRLAGSQVAFNSGELPPYYDDPTTANVNIEIPESFDASAKWPFCSSINHVPDQGFCGSCWAVSAAAVMTDRLCIASHGAFRYPISAEELMSCCPECSAKGDGCVEGNHYLAWKYIQSHGLVTGGDYGSNIGCQPYQLQPCGHSDQSTRIGCDYVKTRSPTCVRRCLNRNYYNAYDKDHYKVRAAFVIHNDEKAIQREILQRGPVGAVFNMYVDLGNYKSGVYQRVSNELIGGHAVKIIGWGAENGLDYWLVVNSWNTDWGDKGFFKVRRMNNGVNFEKVVTYPVV